MKRILGWMAVVMLCCAAGAATAEEPGDARLREAQTAFDEAKKLQEAGKYSEALARGEHALALWEAVFGGSHPEVARGLQLLGALHHSMGALSRAEPLFQRSLKIREAALGKDHPDVAGSLNGLGRLYSDQGLYERAESLLKRAVEVQEAALGKTHLDVAVPLNNLANLYRRRGLFAQAEQLFKRTIAIREAALGKDDPLVARTLSNLATVYQSQGLTARAEPLLLRALSILETSLGKTHPDIATVLNNLGTIYLEQSAYERALTTYERALSVREEALGRNHPLVASALNNLATVHTKLGAYDQAMPLHERALAITEASLGKAHPELAPGLFGLADIHSDLGSYEQAEPLLQRALAILEAAFGKDHPMVADALNNLAEIYRHQGLYGRAEPLYQRALALMEATLGPRHPRVAYPLNNLAVLYREQGLYERAEPLLQRALAIREEALGKNHPDFAGSLSTLAGLYKDQALYDQAKPLYERALVIYEATGGKRHRDVARILNNLGELYWQQGAYGQAEPLIQRALTLWKAALGKNHPHVANSLGLLGRVRLSRNRLDAALPLLTDAFALSERRLRQEGLDFSESRLTDFLQYLRAEEEVLYALLRSHPDNPRVRRLALTASLLLKSRSTAESADTSRTVYQSLGTEDRERFARLRGLRTRLAVLSFQGPGSLSPAAYQKRLKELADEGDALEADLARRSAPLRALASYPSPSEVVERVAAALPKDAALVEFIAYTDHPLHPRPGTSSAELPSQPRYLALVLLPDASIRALDLGPAEPINSAASRLRDALANLDAAFLAPAQELYQLAFRPLLPLLGGRHRLMLSMDGQLSLVPFGALHDGRQFLIDAYDLTYLTSGRDLLPRPQDKNRPGSVVVLADPDFSAAVPSSLSKTAEPAERSASLERFFSTPRADLASTPWVPLPGSRREAESIKRLLPQAQLFLGPEATKQRLLKLPTPGILHVATHGFFLEDAPVPKGSRGVGHFGALGDNPNAPRPPDPLLRSGLILAGAASQATAAPDAASPPPDNALVTALELAGLDLWGTQLVVLAACDTGRGDVKLGQGVSGLRRAFVVAGAETVVMSLWKVNDGTTGTLMEAYYRNLLAGQGRAAALREAMRSFRQREPHPHYWAPFIAVGRDAPLLALTPLPRQPREPKPAEAH